MTTTKKQAVKKSATKNGTTQKGAKKKVRYAVVGLGHIAQVAVLPAFKNAARNSELVALVSDDVEKLKELGEQYGVERQHSYKDYDRLLKSGEIDAVYIALPNSLHREYAVRAFKRGVHVLCEKPMAVTERECEKMIRAARKNNAKLMIAYRLHFEEANLKAIEVVQSGKIGELRIFNSVFSQQVVAGDIRLKKNLGGGTLYDIGIYCINAARYLFRSEPVEVFAVSAKSSDRRFREVDEMTNAVLRFPGERLATFTCSFGAEQVRSYQIVGTKGDLRVDPAYEYQETLEHHLTVDGKTETRRFAKRDQFAPELLYFSDCITNNREPEPSGGEGLIDIVIIRALLRSAKSGKFVKLGRFGRRPRPTMKQEIERPALKKPKLVNTVSPSGEK